MAQLRTLAALACALLLAACGGGVAEPDRKDPASVARAFVEAFNAKDLQRMLPLNDAVNIEAIAAALTSGPGSSDYDAIFVPDMVTRLAAEAGNVEGPRYDRHDAIVKVASTDRGEVYTIVMAKNDNGDWTIVAHSMMGRAQFDALPDTPPEK
jgi:ketosteroid isomerase-like protein